MATRFPLLVLCLLLLGEYSTSLRPDSLTKLLQAEQTGFKIDLIRPASPATSSQVRQLISMSKARTRWMASRFGSSFMRADDHHHGGDYDGTGSFQSVLSPDGGGYLMEISVGTPPQTFKAIADTGSDLVWVQSDPCDTCTSGNLFHPSSSSSYRTMSCRSSACEQILESTCGTHRACEYEYDNGIGHTQGTLGQDTLSLSTTSGGSHGFTQVVIGCGQSNDGFQGFEGLVGLGQGAVSLPSQLSRQIGQKFSYCMVDLTNATARSPMFFGSAAALTGTDVASTPIISSARFPSYYLVDVESIVVGSRTFHSPGTTIIDSATTLTYLPGRLVNRLEQAFAALIRLPKVNAMYDVGLDLCYNASGNPNYKFPSLTINFQGATIQPPAPNYFVQVDGLTCLAIAANDGLPVSIIGNLMQQSYHILYDRGASTISFQPQNCSSL